MRGIDGELGDVCWQGGQLDGRATGACAEREEGKVACGGTQSVSRAGGQAGRQGASASREGGSGTNQLLVGLIEEDGVVGLAGYQRAILCGWTCAGNGGTALLVHSDVRAS